MFSFKKKETSGIHPTKLKNSVTGVATLISLWYKVIAVITVLTGAILSVIACIVFFNRTRNQETAV